MRRSSSRKRSTMALARPLFSAAVTSRRLAARISACPAESALRNPTRRFVLLGARQKPQHTRSRASLSADSKHLLSSVHGKLSTTSSDPGSRLAPRDVVLLSSKLLARHVALREHRCHRRRGDRPGGGRQPGPSPARRRRGESLVRGLADPGRARALHGSRDGRARLRRDSGSLLRALPAHLGGLSVALARRRRARRRQARVGDRVLGGLGLARRVGRCIVPSPSIACRPVRRRDLCACGVRWIREA